MATQSHALRRDIALKREEIATDVDRLRAEIRDTYASATNWRAPLRHRPMLAAGVALLLGAALGYLVANRIRHYS